jgi:hypothetical protein
MIVSNKCKGCDFIKILNKLEKENKYFNDCIDAEHTLNERLLRESKEGISYDKLKKQIKELKKYVKHKTGCIYGYKYGKAVWKDCTCGLNNLLKDKK